MKNKNEKGAVIVEATIVFPVMFLVIFFMIFMGNAYLQKCRVESLITQCALEGAANCADPRLSSVEAGTIPDLDGLDVYPYRYFATSNSGYGSDVAGEVETKLRKQINQLSTGLFWGMKPVAEDVTAKYTNRFLYSNFTVEATYKIKMPIRLLGQEDFMSLHMGTTVQVPVSDSVEMIRNIDMVWDYMERTGAAEKITAVKEKLTNALDKVNEWFEG